MLNEKCVFSLFYKQIEKNYTTKMNTQGVWWADILDFLFLAKASWHTQCERILKPSSKKFSACYEIADSEKSVPDIPHVSLSYEFILFEKAKFWYDPGARCPMYAKLNKKTKQDC